MCENILEWIICYYLTPMMTNAMPVLVSGSKPIDNGVLFIDGKPLLGKNKTWEGLLMGLVGAYITASTISAILNKPYLLPLACGAGLAALIGDLMGAFIKRRLNIAPGAPAPILDQLDFYAATTLYYYLLSVDDVISRPIYLLLTALIIVIFHVTSNLLAYAIGLKKSKF